MARFRHIIGAAVAMLLSIATAIPAYAQTGVSADASGRSNTYYQQRIVRSFERVGEPRFSLSFTTSLDAPGTFDLSSYITHPCYRVTGPAERAYCVSLFGPYADLGGTLIAGHLEEMLLLYSPFTDIALIANAKTEVLGESDEEPATERGRGLGRAQQIWAACRARFSSVHEQNACFARNRGLLRRNSAIDIHGNVR